ncbi:ATP-dependent DNA ligase [Candidatus Woesearchaeota archaeon]|nr:MAG: ATP-dependent DNA ligase [Candidatus Woesearchaeota archaeon]
MDYSQLVETYKKLESTTKRLEKTTIISNLLRETKTEDLRMIVLLLQGKIFPAWDEREIGVASRLVIKAISLATGSSANEIEDKWKQTGDLGLVSEHFTTGKRQKTLFSQKLTVKKVFSNLQKLATLEGKGTVTKKIQLLAELLTSASPDEAKYIVRTVLCELRVGIGSGTMRDAIIEAFFDEKDKETVQIVQNAYDLTNDFGEVAEIAKAKGINSLKNIPLTVGRPIKVMLYMKAKNISDGFERVGKPAAIEYKYDGFRIQLHGKNGSIKLFTRRLEDVTAQFPDIVKIVKGLIKADEFILDGEVIGIDAKTKKWLPFQNISQRIKRKYDIEKVAKEVPVMLNLFDAMQVKGENIINKPFRERRTMLKKITEEQPNKLELARQIITSDEKKAEDFYKESLKKGNEGIMMKNLEAVYKPGSRVGYGVKVKPTMENLDVVITGAEWGEGKRANWLTSFTIAIIDDDKNLLEVGKVGTGIKEKEAGLTFEKLTGLLKPLIISEKGREVKVKPEIVIEVSYEEIQKSPTYSSGYALRFPRVISLREDMSADDCSTLNVLEDLYQNQR